MSTPIEHSERAHALLGASKAEQWLNCPPSARLQESIPDTESEYAKQGTAAHELAEIKLRQLLGVNDSAERRRLTSALNTAMSSPYYDAEMESAVNSYVDTVAAVFMAAKARSKDAVILFEERLDFSAWVPEGFGTGDVLIISDGIMDVIDLKYGKGVPVSAVDNSQMRLYGFGGYQAYDWLYGIIEIHMMIVQPRLDSVSTDEITAIDLLAWGETIVKPAAALAFAGEGEFSAGDHCRWCKVKASCRARTDANMAAIAYEFKEPALLDEDELASILHVAGQLQAWAKDVENYAYEQATKKQARFPGWKLVEGRSNRAITDKKKAASILMSHTLDTEKVMKPQELLGISDLEKRIGKKELQELIGDLIIKPPGKPVLVPESDRREELGSIDSDFAGEEF